MGWDGRWMCDGWMSFSLEQTEIGTCRYLHQFELGISMVTRRYQYASSDGTSSCGFPIQGDTVNRNRVSQWTDASLNRLIPMALARRNPGSTEIQSIGVDCLNGAASTLMYQACWYYHVWPSTRRIKTKCREDLTSTSSGQI
jgi:hypothetical protein